MSEETKVNDGDSEENTNSTPGSESENTQAGEGDTSSSETDSSESNDKATAFDESLLETEGSEKTPLTTEAKQEDAFSNKQKQVDTWATRFDGRINPKTNEPYIIDDIPHDWLKQEVADKLHESKPAPDIQPQKENFNVLEEFDYRQLLKQIPELPKSKQKEIADLAKELQNDGVKSKFKSLKRALDIASISLEAEARGKKAALLGVSGGGSSGGINTSDKKTVTPEFTKNTGITKEDVKKIEKFNFLNPNK